MRWPTLVVLMLFCADGLAQKAAEVVSVQGQGESRTDERSAWKPAVAHQELLPASFVRTGAYSRMGLLFQDRTQVRLAEKTIMQIKASGAGDITVMRLEQGRSWSQTNTPSANLYLETPSATAAIRGTDWEVEVFEGGRSLLTVLSGEVEFFNAFGTVKVMKNEAAQAIPGQAPVKVLIANPRDRVQWVTAYSIDPMRHIDLAHATGAERARLERIAQLVTSQQLEPAFAAAIEEISSGRATQPAAYLIASDLMVHQGRLDRAADYAQQALARFRDDPRALAQLARIDLAAGNFATARSRLEPALAAATPPFEVRLAAADVSRAQGEAREARAGYRSARDERPVDDRPWYGIGVVDAEREAVASGRSNLQAALERNPAGAGYQGELGTLETFADRFEPGEAAFRSALAANPSDYVALTGLGVLELKRGHPDAALESLLAASVLEPRYARAHVFAAVAHYQLRRHELALRELARASELDDKDPLPYLLASMIQTDLYRAADAIASARQALKLLPYLKSLNQVANDRQGGANLGRSLSFFGLEEWAQNRAQESYYPYWAGSHLFLSDRYPGEFNKNSELLQGFLTDPTVFGASNRFQSLISSPGNYGRVLLGYSYGDAARAFIPIGRFNGMSYVGMPVAYLVDLDQTHFRFGGSASGPSDGRAFTGAVGLRPLHELGLFLYGFDTSSDDKTRGAGFDYASKLKTSSVTAGLHYRLSPQSQLWVRAGTLRNDTDAAGTLIGAPFEQHLVARQPEYGLRHTFDAGAHQLTWGVESAHKKLHDDFVQPVGGGARLVTTLLFDERSRNAFISDTVDVSPRLRIEADAWWQDNSRDLGKESLGFIPGLDPVPFGSATEERSRRKVTPRVGLRAVVAENVIVRAAYQDWVRPMGTSTLGPVATAGIPMDDRVVARGGRQKRSSAQLEIEATPRTFLTAYAERKEIDNLRFSFSPFLIVEDENLSKLRDFDYGRLSAGDLYEFISAPEFDAGKFTIGGAAVNRIVSDVVSFSLKYQYTDSRNTGATFAGNRIAYHPRHAAAIGVTYVGPERIYFTSRAVYRTLRYTDEANLGSFRPGWDGAMDFFWESIGKRLRVRLGVDNAWHKEKSPQYSASVVLNF